MLRVTSLTFSFQPLMTHTSGTWQTIVFVFIFPLCVRTDFQNMRVYLYTCVCMCCVRVPQHEEKEK